MSNFVSTCGERIRRTVLIVGGTVLLFAALLPGCSRGPRYTLVPASGTLLIDGEPAANILVQFMPDASLGTAGPTSTAVTDEAGRFMLTTVDDRPGAAEGSHVVVLFDMEEDRPAQGEESTRPARLSSAYATPRGGLRVSVSPGESLTLNASRDYVSDDLATADWAVEEEPEPKHTAASRPGTRPQPAAVDPAEALLDRRVGKQ